MSVSEALPLSGVGGLSGTATFGAVSACGRSLGWRRCLPGKPSHVGLRSKDTCKEAGDGEVGIELFPMKAIAAAKDFDLRELVISRAFETLGQPWRKREQAAVGQLDNDTSGSTVIPRA